MRDVAARSEMKIVDGPDLVTSGHEAITQMAADEAGAAGHQCAHGGLAPGPAGSSLNARSAAEVGIGSATPSARIISEKMKVWNAAITSHKPMTAQWVSIPSSGRR